MKRLLAFLFVFLLAGPAFGAVVRSRVMPDNAEIKIYSWSNIPGFTDYSGASGLVDWEIATRGNIAGAGAKSPVLQCFADVTPFEIQNSIAFQGGAGNTSATKFRVIMAYPGHENRFRKNAGVVFKQTMHTVTSTFYFGEQYARIYDLGITSSAWNDATNRQLVYSYSYGQYSRAIGCYAFDLANAGAGVFNAFHGRIADTVFENCAATGIKGGGFVSHVAGTEFNNCTSTGNGYGFYAIENGIARNCIDQGSTLLPAFSAGAGKSWTLTTCAGDAGVVFKSDGISLDKSDTVARNQGITLPNFNDDGMGRQRGNGRTTGPAWDIGAIEFYAPLSARRIPFFLY